ncbi:hypothetical protein GGF41_008672, partial [Coemansia sp. RSA 2531]
SAHMAVEHVPSEPTVRTHSQSAALVSIPFALGVVSFYYIGWFNREFGTANIPVAFFFIPIPLTIIIVVHDEIRKLAVRTYLNGLLVHIA